MDIDVKDEHSVTIIAVSGELDASSSARLTETLDPLVSAGRRRLVIDLSGVSFIDSAGLSVLVQCFKHARSAAGSLRLAGLQPAVRRVFELTRLDRVFDLHSNTAEAVQRFAGG
jgi:anti-sigma B factor antagonist